MLDIIGILTLAILVLFPIYLIYLFFTGKKNDAISLIRPAKKKLLFTIGTWGLLLLKWYFVDRFYVICPDVVGVTMDQCIDSAFEMLPIYFIALYFLSCLIFREKKK